MLDKCILDCHGYLQFITFVIAIIHTCLVNYMYSNSYEYDDAKSAK